MIGIYVMVELHDQPRQYGVCGGADQILHDESAPLNETLVNKLDARVPAGLFGEMPGVLVGLLAKLFLYMQSESARIVRHQDHTEQVRRLTQVRSSRKLGKLQKRAARMYDWVEVGPAALSTGLAPGDLPPHWRRGHLRQQAHGPQHNGRKLVFIMPTMVRVDRLANAPTPLTIRTQSEAA